MAPRLQTSPPGEQPQVARTCSSVLKLSEVTRYDVRLPNVTTLCCETRAKASGSSAAAHSWAALAAGPRIVRAARDARDGVAVERWLRYARGMASDPKVFDRLARALAKLPAWDRAQIMAEAARRAKKLQADSHFRRPILAGGNEWVGGGLSREELYGDDGR